MMDELTKKIAACDVEIQHFFEALNEENRKLQKKIVELEFKTKYAKAIQIFKWSGGEGLWFSVYEEITCGFCGSFKTGGRRSLLEKNFFSFNGKSSWNSWEEFCEDCFDSKIREQVKNLI